MACGWSRSYVSLQPGACTTTFCCGGNCVGTLNSGQGSILADFASSLDAATAAGITSCGQIFHFLGLELKKRLSAASVIATYASTTTSILKVQLSQVQSDQASVTLQEAGNCKFPITCQWSKAKNNSSGTSRFNSLDDLLNYLVLNLRN